MGASHGCPGLKRATLRLVPGWVSIPEIILLLVVVLLIFGPKRVPEIGRSLGKGMREFKQSITGKDEESHEVGTELPPAREHDTTVS